MTTSARDRTRTSVGRPSSRAYSRMSAVAERVERRDRRVRVAVRHELVDPDRHLLGRLVGERQGEDLRRPRPTGRDQPGDPAGDDLGLAGPGAGHDQQRPVAVGDRAELVRVQAAEQGVQARRRRSPVVRRVHDRHEVAPGRQLVERRRLAPPNGYARPGHGERGRRSGSMWWGPCPEHRRPP